MDYQEAWSFLDNLQFFKIKLGLDSMTKFLENVGHPQRKIQFIHVGGTNGKGSMSVTLLTLLSKAGYQVGLYTSPHLSSVRERFRINDTYISKKDFAEIATQIRDILDGRQITYFEFTTALAMLWFVKKNVDLAILEVGMGGRLDATNVIEPLVSVITNVSMDHEAYLGNTLSEIAQEKAGIIKKDIPVVSAVAKDISRTIVEETCQNKNAPLYILDQDFFAHGKNDTSWSYQGIHGNMIDDIHCSLKGEHQINNTAVALATLELLEDKGFAIDFSAINENLQKVQWPGRLEYFCLESAPKKNGLPEKPISCADARNNHRHSNSLRRVVLDGAHNPAGVISLKNALETEFDYQKLIMVWGSMADKDIEGTMSVITPISDHIILTMPEGERSATPEKLQTALPEEYHGNVHCVRSVEEALKKAYDLTTEKDLICIAGSLYLIGAARKLLLGELVD